MIAALIVAKSFSATGADLAINTSTKLMGTATLGTAGFVGRRTIGAGSAGLAQSVRSSRIGKTEFGRNLAGVFDRGSRASFDARNTGAVKSLSKNKVLPVNLGKAAPTGEHGGFHGVEEAAITARTKYADTLKMSDAQIKETARLKDVRKKLDSDWKSRNAELGNKIDTGTKDATKNAKDRADLVAQQATAQKEWEAAFTSGNVAAQGVASQKKASITAQISSLDDTIAAGTRDLKKAQDDRATEEKAYNEKIAGIKDDLIKNDHACNMPIT